VLFCEVYAWLTLAVLSAEVVAGVTRIAHSSITQVITAPVPPDGRIATTIERFQTEVIPRVHQKLAIMNLWRSIPQHLNLFMSRSVL
jgi:hypothetical protein